MSQTSWFFGNNLKKIDVKNDWNNLSCCEWKETWFININWEKLTLSFCHLFSERKWKIYLMTAYWLFLRGLEMQYWGKLGLLYFWYKWFLFYQKMVLFLWNFLISNFKVVFHKIKNLVRGVARIWKKCLKIS